MISRKHLCVKLLEIFSKLCLNCRVHSMLVGNETSLECHHSAKNVNSIDHDECIDGNDESWSKCGNS